MESISSFENAEGLLPPVTSSPFSGLDRLIFHKDFYRLLDLAIKVKALKHNGSNSKDIIQVSDDDIHDMIMKIRSKMLASDDNMAQGQLVLSRDQSHESDEAMNNFIDSLSKDLEQLKIVNDGNSGQHAITSTNRKSTQKVKQCGDAFGIKYSKRQTDILLSWMIQNRYHPFPDGNQIALLGQETGLTNSQIINWATNVRKRNLKGTVEGGKKPHHFLDFLFLAVHREKNLPIAISPVFKKSPPRKKVNKKTKVPVKTARVLSMGGANSYHMITPLSYPGWTGGTPWNDKGYQWNSSSTIYQNMANTLPRSNYSYGPYDPSIYVPASNASFTSSFGVAPLPTLFDSTCQDDIQWSCITDIDNESKANAARAVSPSFLDEKIVKVGVSSEKGQVIVSSTSCKKMRRSNSLTEAFQNPDAFWMKKDTTLMEENNVMALSGETSYGIELLWNDTEVLTQFTQGGLLNTPRDPDEDDQSLGMPVEGSSSHQPDIFRASLTENEIMYLLSSDEDDTFIDLTLDEKIPVAI